MANSIKEREKEIITGMLRALSKGKVPEEYIKETTEEIFMLEVQENMGYNYDPIYFTQRMSNGSISTLDEVRRYMIRQGNDINLDFVHNEQEKATSGKSIAGKVEKRKITPRVIINLSSDEIEKIKSENPEERLASYKKMLHTLFHENQHAMVNWMNEKRIISKENIRNARDHALIRTLDEEWYSYSGVTGNYEAYSTEKDADRTAFEKYLDIMGEEDTDPEIEDKIDILKGKSELGRYKVNVDSRDNTTHYQSNGSEEKDDITIPILDDLICRKGLTELLEEYPILTEEYNLDGTKKSVIDLIKNMKEKIEEVSQDTELSSEEKEITITARQEFYYELIYNALEKNSPGQNKQIVDEIGEQETKKLFESLTQYFQNEKEKKQKTLKNMIISQEMSEDRIEPSNNGTTLVKLYSIGKVAKANKKGFVKYMTENYPEQMDKKYTVHTSDGKTRRESAKEIVERNFEYLPRKGDFISGEKVYSIEHVMSSYLTAIEQGIPVSFVQFMKETGLTVDSNEQYITDFERIENYHEGKKKIISQVSNQVFKGIEIQNPRKSKVKITPKDIKSTLYNFPLGWQEIAETASKIASPEKGKDTKDQAR